MSVVEDMKKDHISVWKSDHTHTHTHTHTSFEQPKLFGQNIELYNSFVKVRLYELAEKKKRE
jgi:hypothetical protein